MVKLFDGIDRAGREPTDEKESKPMADYIERRALIAFFSRRFSEKHHTNQFKEE